MLADVPLDTIEAALRGHAEVEHHADGIQPLRLPMWTRDKQADRAIEVWSSLTLGVRLCLRTSATRLQLTISATRMVLRGETEPLFTADLVVESDGVTIAEAHLDDTPLSVTEADGSIATKPGPRSVIDIEVPGGDGERDVTVWLPHNAATVIHGLTADAPVTVAPPSARPLWLHHGSSISHCLEAVEPRGPWPQQAAAALNLDITNDGFGGNAQLDYFVARTLAALPADVITLKLGVNVVNADSMRRRAFVPALNGFLDVVREGHPQTPIVVITPVTTPIIEDAPGPTVKVDGRFRAATRTITPGDGTLTLGIVRDTVREVVEHRMQHDALLWCADGRELLTAADSHLLWDDLHPNQEGYDRIAERFIERARDPATPLGSAFARVLR